ncbi:MFS transporter [Vibrio sp. MACH09]|uniref:MFS transporter n=1 Tax=Vibrio sp. MACH09 TaxID=3025122 RepID=UPI0027901F6D|nr:MFS transporter [Vibrio sp. MACH09]GLO63271.1 MFS transporter [Vibrio sp. MACH09]
MLKNRNYLRLLLAQITSLTGTGVSSICLALLAYDLAESEVSMVLSTIFAIKMLTYILLAPVLSTVSQKLPVGKTMVALDLVRAGVFAFMPFVSSLWEVYFLTFLINACSAWFTPLYQSTLPLVVTDKHDYTKALSLSRLAYDLEQLVSPLLAALLLSVISFRQLFIFDAATFVVSAILILFCIIPSSSKVKHQPNLFIVAGVTKGIWNYLSKPSLKALWMAYLSAASASAMVLVNTVVYVHDVLDGGEQQIAWAMMIVGLGSMVIAFKLPSWLKFTSPQTFHWVGMAAIFGAFLLGFFTPGWAGYIVVCLALGVGMSCIQTTSGLLIREACMDEESSPYFAAHFSLTHFWWLITYLSAGVSVKLFGLSAGYLCMATFCLLGMVAYYFFSTSSTCSRAPY